MQVNHMVGHIKILEGFIIFVLKNLVDHLTITSSPPGKLISLNIVLR